MTEGVSQLILDPDMKLVLKHNSLKIHYLYKFSDYMTISVSQLILDPDIDSGSEDPVR